MNGEELDSVAQLRLVGIGLIIGGLLFGAVTIALDVPIAGSILIGVGTAVWFVEYRSQRTVGIGLGIAVAGLIGLLESTFPTGLAPLETAAFIVAGGVGDYLLAPVYIRIQEAGQKVGRE